MTRSSLHWKLKSLINFIFVYCGSNHKTYVSTTSLRLNDDIVFKTVEVRALQRFVPCQLSKALVSVISLQFFHLLPFPYSPPFPLPSFWLCISLLGLPLLLLWIQTAQVSMNATPFLQRIRPPNVIQCLTRVFGLYFFRFLISLESYTSYSQQKLKYLMTYAMLWE